MSTTAFSALLFLASIGLAAQPSVPVAAQGSFLFDERGLQVGYGMGKVPEHTYNMLFLTAHLGLDMLNRKTQPARHLSVFTVYLEPQVNLVMGASKDFEGGINVGFKYMYPLTGRVYPYLLIGAGPHFITVKTNQQSNGFIFSDNFGAGIYVFTAPTTALEFGLRGRHLSNAQLREPNGGINSLLVYLGVKVFLRPIYVQGK